MEPWSLFTPRAVQHPKHGEALTNFFITSFIQFSSVVANDNAAPVVN